MKETNKKYDVVIIGGGLGGLVSGAILSKNGFKVLVLDKNKQIGGNLQVFTRNKRVFDTGVHYVGSLGEGQNLQQLFKYLGIFDKLNIEKMDAVFDKVHFKNEEKYYSHAQGHEAFVRELIKEFPHEEEGLKKYVKELKDVCDSFPFYRLKYTESNYYNDEKITRKAKDYIEEIIQDKKLQNVLSGSISLYGGLADSTPFFVHALVINSYIESAYRFINGGSQIAIELCKVIRANGGDILKKKEVVSATFGKDGLMKTVVTFDGGSYSANQFISNLHPVQGFKIFGEDRFKKVYVNRIKDLKNSVSSFSLHLALKEEMLPYQNFNIYQQNKESVWGHEDYTEANWPLSYLVSMSPNKKNQKWADSISILCYMRYDEVAEWGDTFNTVDQESERHEEYQVFKKKKEQTLINDLQKIYPNIKECIVDIHSSTPLSFRDYIGTQDGSMYGFVKDADNPLRTVINNKTRVKNLYLVGQNISLHGVLGVTISSFLTCFNFVDRDKIIAEIHEK